MRSSSGNWLSITLPVGVFAAAYTLHYIWLGLFPEQDPIQSQWLPLPAEGHWLQRYVETRNYWLGYSYGLSAAFASAALLNYLKSPCWASRAYAIGGATFTGLLAVSGCFLVGCCGSPMLIVWLALFGAAFVPLAKPLVALVTTITIAAAWVWMLRRKATQQVQIAQSPSVPPNASDASEP